MATTTRTSIGCLSAISISEGRKDPAPSLPITLPWTHFTNPQIHSDISLKQAPSPAKNNILDGAFIVVKSAANHRLGTLHPLAIVAKSSTPRRTSPALEHVSYSRFRENVLKLQCASGSEVKFRIWQPGHDGPKPAPAFEEICTGEDDETRTRQLIEALEWQKSTRWHEKKKFKFWIGVDTGGPPAVPKSWLPREQS